MRSIVLFLYEKGAPASVAITTSCNECGTPFEFMAQSSQTILVSGNRQEIRLLIAEAADTENADPWEDIEE